MKALRLLIALVAIFSASLITSVAYGQKPIQVTRELTRKDNNGDALHRIANEFSTAVGNKLKEGRPLSIQEISVELICRNGEITLRYTATLLPCREEEADYYFDRRGSLSFGSDEMTVYRDANDRMMQQVEEALPKFQETFPGKGRVRTIVKYVTARGCPAGASALHEAFFIVKKK